MGHHNTSTNVNTHTPMSAFARSPESYAAWQQLKRNVTLRVNQVRGPHDSDDDDEQQRAQRNRGTQELHRLLSRTSNIKFFNIPFLVLSCSCRLYFVFF
jgi:hypothetical protein